MKTTEEKALVTISNKWGLHARVSFKVASSAKGFDADITLEKDGNMANAKMMDELLMLCAQYGDTVLVRASGPQGREAVEALAEILRSCAEGE